MGYFIGAIHQLKLMVKIMPTEITSPSIGTGAGTENTTPVVPPVIPQDGIDYLAAVAALEDENKRLTVERENYRSGYLKATSKLKLKDIEPEDKMASDDERIRSIVAQQLADSQLMQNQQKMADLVKKMARENQELKLASVNKPGTSSAIAGAGAAPSPTLTQGISAETVDLMKKRGWSDKMIEKYKENLKKPLGK